MAVDLGFLTRGILAIYARGDEFTVIATYKDWTCEFLDDLTDANVIFSYSKVHWRTDLNNFGMEFEVCLSTLAPWIRISVPWDDDLITTIPADATDPTDDYDCAMRGL